MTVRYIVHDDNALGYVDDRVPWQMGVLAGDVFKRGPDPKNGPIYISGPTRPATLEDFRRFRVMPPQDLFLLATPLDLGGVVIGMVEDPDGSIRIVP